MTKDEMNAILQYVRESLLTDLDVKIDTWRENYNGEDSPSVHFEFLKSALDDYKDEFSNNDEICGLIADAMRRIDQVADTLNSEYEKNKDDQFSEKSSSSHSDSCESRSIFDDVDL